LTKSQPPATRAGKWWSGGGGRGELIRFCGGLTGRSNPWEEGKGGDSLRLQYYTWGAGCRRVWGVGQDGGGGNVVGRAVRPSPVPFLHRTRFNHHIVREVRLRGSTNSAEDGIPGVAPKRLRSIVPRLLHQYFRGRK